MSFFTPNSELRTPNSGVPWPIALLSLLYGVIATLAAASAWKIAVGISHRQILWPLAWLGCSAGSTYGLALLKPWGRVLAICTSVLLLVVTLAIAGWFVASGRPVAGLLVACSAGTHVVVIRYLQRPAVRAYFQGTAASTQSSAPSH